MDYYCCSLHQSCPALCNLMNCTTPGSPALHYLLEFAQTHVHRVDDAIQPSQAIVTDYSFVTRSESRVWVYYHGSFGQCPWSRISVLTLRSSSCESARWERRWYPSYPGLRTLSIKMFTNMMKTWMEEPGRLQSMGSWRVGHDWSGLAAAAAAEQLY